jgi:leucyl aminopeptidase
MTLAEEHMRTSLVVVAIASMVVAHGERAAAQVGDRVWITVGEDAFDAINRRLAPQGLEPAVTAVARDRGVVLTHIEPEQLLVLEELVHAEFGRCGGYMRHDSRIDGEETLGALARVASRQPEGVPFAIDQAGWVSRIGANLDPAEILATITSLSTNWPNRYHAHPSGTAAATWIRDLWAGYAANRPEVTVALLPHTSTPQPSVRLTIPGRSLPNEVVVLGGHLDSTASGSSSPTFAAPGADDDASGIATLSEVLRVVLASGYRPERTVEVYGYAAEEVGLEGSEEIAEAAATAGVEVVAVLQQDMTAYNGSTQDIWFITDYTNAALTAFLQNLLGTYWPELTWSTTACGYGCSDHAAWHREGYPAAFAFESRFGQHNPQIHRTTDTVATLGASAAHALKFARLATSFLIEAGSDGPEVLFADGFESGDYSAWEYGEE